MMQTLATNRKINMNYRYLGYIITALGIILMISFTINEEKQFQYWSLISAIIGLILTFESSRVRAFKFSKSDWIENNDEKDYYVEIRKIQHLKNSPTPKVFEENENGEIEEIGVGIKVMKNKNVRIYASKRIENTVIVKI